MKVRVSPTAAAAWATVLLTLWNSAAAEVACDTDCAALSSECEIFDCDTDTGNCYSVFADRGTPCEFTGDLCSVNDVCNGRGRCRRGDPKDCSGLGDQCNVGVCHPETGNCGLQPVNVGASCDDGLFCTVFDVCNEHGVCEGQERNCLRGGPDQCRPATCDEEADECVVNILEGEPCDDGNPCTEEDQCDANGACVGFEIDCRDWGEGPCGYGTCNVLDGTCAFVPTPGASCDDGNDCTANDRCTFNGTCAGDPEDCSFMLSSSVADEQCAYGTCLDKSCVVMVVPANTTCNDRDLCTINDTCQPDGSCAGTPRNCSELTDVCNTGVCSPLTGSCEAVPMADFTECDDLDVCTEQTLCMSGRCVGKPVYCGELDNQCNVGICNVDGQCERQALTGFACDDGDNCTYSDICTDEGTCVGIAMDCSIYSNDCQNSWCSAETGFCEIETIAEKEGESCNDLDACTVDDRCISGTCVGENLNCSGQGDQCNEAFCVDGSCELTARTGALCDDGFNCTFTDICNPEGVCEGLPHECIGEDECHVGVCNEAAGGICESQPVEGDCRVECPPSRPIWDEESKTCMDCGRGIPDGNGGCNCVEDRFCMDPSTGRCTIMSNTFDGTLNRYVCPDELRRLRGSLE